MNYITQDSSQTHHKREKNATEAFDRLPSAAACMQNRPIARVPSAYSADVPTVSTVRSFRGKRAYATLLSVISIPVHRRPFSRLILANCIDERPTKQRYPV